MAPALGLVRLVLVREPGDLGALGLGHDGDLHLGLGEHDDVMACLEQAFSMRAVDLAVVRIDARFAPIAADPRFNALLERMNLESRTDKG